MPGATFPDLSVFDAVRVRARRRRPPRLGGGRWGRWSTLVIVAAVLAGCTAEAEVPEPVPTTTSVEPSVEPTTTEPEPEPEPEPTGLVRPEAMDRNDDTGAIAAAEYFAQLAYEIARTGDPAPLSDMSDESCQFCGAAARLVDETWSEGGRFDGAEVTISAPGAIQAREELLGVIGVEVPVEVAAQQQLDASGNEVASWDAWSGHFYVEVVHSYKGWVVMRVQVY